MKPIFLEMKTRIEHKNTCHTVFHAQCDLPFLSHQKRESVDVLQCNSCTFGHTMQGVFGYMELNVYLVGQTPAQTAQQRTATREVNAIFHDVGIQFRRRVLQCTQHCGLDARHRPVDAMGMLIGRAVILFGPATSKSSGASSPRSDKAEPTLILMRSAIRSLTFMLC